MKKTKFVKIFAPVVAIALLVGALVGISAFAADAPEIISMNVEYGSELYLYYAVDKESVKGVPALEVVTSDGALIDTVTAYEEETVNEKACYIFKTSGIAPGQINAIEYVRASGDNGKGDIVSYSVEEYLYTRLFKQGFAAKTSADGDDYLRRNLYFGLLEYARSAQNLFYRDSADKIADSTYVAIKGNAAASGEYSAFDVIALAAPAIQGFDYWKVTELAPYGKVLREHKLAAGYEYTVTGNAIIVPVADDDEAEGVAAYDPNAVSFTTPSDKVTFAGSNQTVNFSRDYDGESANWYYTIDKFAKNMGVVTINILPTGGDAATATTMALDFDIFIPADVTLGFQGNILRTGSGSSTTYLWAPFLQQITPDAKYSNNVIKGAWNHIRVIYEPNADFVPDAQNNPYDKGSFVAKMYINNLETPVETTDENYSKKRSDGKKFDIPKLTEITGYTFAFNNGSYGEMKLDNVSLVFK